MPVAPIAASLRRFANAAAGDADLLAAFRARCDEAAFAELVRRYAPLVAGVCRRTLGQDQDIEDALQATFLVLARKAHAVTHPERLAGWLHTVALRAAREVRSMRARHRRSDTARPRPEAVSAEMPDGDLAAVLDDELARLPEHYRLAVLCCELQGQSRAEAAAALKIPEGTLSSRLAEAKRRLARRLKQRGVTAGTAVLFAAATRADAGARVADIARAAVAAVAGHASKAASAVALAAADVVIKSMVVSKLNRLALAAVVLTLAGGALTLSPGGGSGAAGNAQAGEPPTRIGEDPAALVRRLGSARYAEREEAQQKLIEMGAKSRAAVRAGAAHQDPEIAKRCAAILPRLTVEELKQSNHPAWVRFKKLVGDNEASRKLFLEMIDDPRRAALLEAAESNPDRAGELYQTELNLRVRALADGYREAERLAEGRTGDLEPGEAPNRGEFGTLLFLGTYPATAAVAFAQSNDVERFAHRNVVGLPLGNQLRSQTVPIPVEVRRLFAAWLAARTDPVPIQFGLHFALYHKIGDALPAARAAAGKDLPPEPRGFALLTIGQLGTKNDLKLLEQSFADRRVFLTGTHAAMNGEGKLVETWVNDTAIAAALRLFGQHPADFGFPQLADYQQRGPDILLKYHLLGFFDAATRTAAHQKARDWLAKQPTKEPTQDEPREPSPELLRDLDDLDKMRQGDSTRYAEVEKRGEALLAKYPDKADRARIYFTLTVVFSNSNINRTSARVTKYGRLALALERDPLRRGHLYSDLGSAAFVDPTEESFEVRRRNATKILLEGYKEVLALKPPAVAPAVPGVMKVSEAPDKAERQRHEAQMKARREADFQRGLVHRRDTLVRQIIEPYERPAASKAELEAAVHSCEHIVCQAIKVFEVVQRIFEAKQELFKKGALSREEIDAEEVNLKRAERTVTNSKDDLFKARAELAKTQVAIGELRQLAEQTLKDRDAVADLIRRVRK